MPRLHLTPGKDPVPILQVAGWAPGLVWMGRKSRPHWDSIPDCPAHSQSLYLLSYPAHRCSMYLTQILRVLVAPPMQGRRNTTQPPFTGFVSPILISHTESLPPVFINKSLKPITLVTTYCYQLCSGAPASFPVSSKPPTSVPIPWRFSCLGSPSVFPPEGVCPLQFSLQLLKCWQRSSHPLHSYYMYQYHTMLHSCLYWQCNHIIISVYPTPASHWLLSHYPQSNP